MIKLGIEDKIELWAYKLRKNYREFGFSFWSLNKVIEISLWYWNIFIIWGKDD